MQRAHPGGGGIKNFLGNWASAVGGSQLGGGLGSMLFGPWGMLLGSIFGQGAGRRAWKAGQTDEKETMRDILFGNPNTKSTLLSNLFNKQPRDGGIQRGQNLGQGVKTFAEYPTLDRWLNRNTDKYLNKPYRGQGKGYNFKDPEQGNNLGLSTNRLNEPIGPGKRIGEYWRDNQGITRS